MLGSRPSGSGVQRTRKVQMEYENVNRRRDDQTSLVTIYQNMSSSIATNVVMFTTPFGALLVES